MREFLGLDAGLMNRRVTFQTRTSGRDAEGGPLDAWTDAFSCWASIRPASSRSIRLAGAEQDAVTHEVIIRYRASVTAKMRIVYQGVPFDIKGAPIDEEMRHEQLTLVCEQGLADG
jgi:SPP1 family predicted phage head-tail adaptor